MSEDPAPSARFVPTRWSLVARASSDDGTARTALEDLCAAYWYPLYAFARRSRSAPEDAEDLVQSFFATLLEKGWLAQADPARGRFRTFLLAAFRHHASHVRERGRALKRGGGRTAVPLDDAEHRYALEPADRLTAEALYERRYALTLLERAWARVAERYRSGGDAKAERFELLRPCVEGADHAPYREIGARLGLGETAVKVAVHRLRGRFREALRREVRDTIEDPDEADAEIRGLLEALGHGA